jgi:hypothetical protein
LRAGDRRRAHPNPGCRSQVNVGVAKDGSYDSHSREDSQLMHLLLAVIFNRGFLRGCGCAVWVIILAIILAVLFHHQLFGSFPPSNQVRDYESPSQRQCQIFVFYVTLVDRPSCCRSQPKEPGPVRKGELHQTYECFPDFGQVMRYSRTGHAGSRWSLSAVPCTGGFSVLDAEDH